MKIPSKIVAEPKYGKLHYIVKYRENWLSKSAKSY